MVEDDSELSRALLVEAAQPLHPAVAAISEAAASRHGDAVSAVLFYGSCLWNGYDEGKLVDLYVLVDDYRTAHRHPIAKLCNWALPPNVYFLETEFQGRAVRAKYAVISLADFRRGATGRWLHSYIWARFAQPSAIARSRSDDDRAEVAALLGESVKTLIRETLPLMPPQSSLRALWTRAFTLTYQAELRAERPGRSAQLYDAAAKRYARVTELALEEPGFPATLRLSGDIVSQDPVDRRRRIAARLRWRRRRVAGKILSTLRLVKAAFTFQDGASYLVWKIQRHSGVGITLTPWQKRHPLFASTLLFWQLYRKGGFR